MQPSPPPEESQGQPPPPPGGGPGGQPAPPPPPPGGAPGPGGQQPSNGLGLASMIIGIISIPLVCCFYIGFLSGIVAAVLGFLGKQKADRGEATNRGQALAGIITGAVAVLLGILSFVLIVVVGTFDAVWTNFDV